MKARSSISPYCGENLEYLGRQRGGTDRESEKHSQRQRWRETKRDRDRGFVGGQSITQGLR